MKNNLLFLFVLLVLASCKNEVDVAPDVDGLSHHTAAVKVVEGILKFENKQHLKSVVKSIDKTDDPTTWKPGFASLLKRQLNIPATEIDQIGATGKLGNHSDVFYFRVSEADTVLTKIIDDPMLASVLNENSQVIIGDTVYAFGLDKVYFSHVANLQSFKEKPTAGSDYMESKREYTTTVFSDKNLARIADNTIEYEKNNRRFVAEFVRHNSGVYQSLVVKVRSQKKNWIGWSGTSAPMLSFNASGTYYVLDYFYQYPFSGSRVGYNTEEVSMFVDEAYNLSIDWITKVGSADCTGTNNVRYQFSF